MGPYDERRGKIEGGLGREDPLASALSPTRLLFSLAAVYVRYRQLRALNRLMIKQRSRSKRI